MLFRSDGDGRPDLLFSQNDGPTVARTLDRQREGILAVVLHGEPGNLAAAGAQRHHAVGIAVRAGTMPAVVVRAGAAGRHEEETALGVEGEGRPGVGGAGDARRLDAPLGVGRILFAARGS